MHIHYGWKDKARGIRLCEGLKYYEWFQLNFRSVLIQFPNKYFTLHKFEVWGPWKVPQMWHSPFKPNSYVDYVNMIHFALSAWTLEMSLNTDSPFSPIWWWILPTFNQPSEVQAFSAKWIIFPYSTYKLGLNGLCHIRGTFYWPQTSNLWSVETRQNLLFLC